MKKFVVSTLVCGFLTAVAAPVLAQDRVSASEKGSFLIYPKVELKWAPAGEGSYTLIQDTFIDITNDYPDDVFVQMHFVNGDAYLAADCYYDSNCTAINGVDFPGCRVCEREHRGWNWVDNKILLTGNEPTYWSAASGLPKGTSPFSILDPGYPPGRPSDEHDGTRVLRGFIVAWAVNNVGEEIRWNHLKGDALIVNYGGSAWEYNAYAFSALEGQNGNVIAGSGELLLDGVEYDSVFDQLLLDFYAVGSSAFSGGGRTVIANTDLTLVPMDIDLRQENEGPTTTKAKFDIWNMNEWKLSGTERCITCWDQTLLSHYDPPNHFLLENLQTDKGKARIDGIASGVVCDRPALFDEGGNEVVPAIVSSDSALLGLSMKWLRFDGGMAVAQSGTNLVGLGTQSAAVRADFIGDVPGERPGVGNSDVKLQRGAFDRLSR